MDELEEITTIDENEITANDREVLMSYNIGPLSGPLMSALLILKSCILKCDTKDAWYNLAQHDQNKGMHFWGQLRNALFKEFDAREFTENTSNTTIGNIRRLITLMYPDLQTKTTQYSQTHEMVGRVYRSVKKTNYMNYKKKNHNKDKE